VIEALTTDVAVVARFDPDLVGDAGSVHAAAGEFGLRRRQRQADHFQASFPRRDLGEPAPTATNPENARAGTRLQSVQDAPVFGELRAGEGTWRIAAVERAGVAHRRIEPESIEVVAEVVVRHDVAPGTGPGVDIEAMLQACREQAPPPAIDGSADVLPVVRQ